jgi:hypothetical protein
MARVQVPAGVHLKAMLKSPPGACAQAPALSGPGVGSRARPPERNSPLVGSTSLAVRRQQSEHVRCCSCASHGCVIQHYGTVRGNHNAQMKPIGQKLFPGDQQTAEAIAWQRVRRLGRENDADHSVMGARRVASGTIDRVIGPRYHGAARR